uniref:Uncharacterized protein n=1 Tax=Pristionchus pacificus TaxID=54126 RepID=A0A8R1UNX9_PRIPA
GAGLGDARGECAAAAYAASDADGRGACKQALFELFAHTIDNQANFSLPTSSLLAAAATFGSDATFLIDDVTTGAATAPSSLSDGGAAAAAIVVDDVDDCVEEVDSDAVVVVEAAAGAATRVSPWESPEIVPSLPPNESGPWYCTFDSFDGNLQH